MKLYQLFYLSSEWYAAVLAGFTGLIGATLVDWAPVSASVGRESVLVGVLTSAVFVTAVAVLNLVVRLWVGGWLAEA